jgi:hypothetical protein
MFIGVAQSLATDFMTSFFMSTLALLRLRRAYSRERSFH